MRRQPLTLYKNLLKYLEKCHNILGIFFFNVVCSTYKTKETHVYCQFGYHIWIFLLCYYQTLTL